MVRPGQTWCTISSPVEGDTYVTVYAPGIQNWDKNKVYATIRWVDCVWEFPQPAQARFGSEHVRGVSIEPRAKLLFLLASV